MRHQTNPFGEGTVQAQRRAEFLTLVQAGKTMHSKVRRVSATRRAIEARARIVAAAQARGDRVRWDEELPSLERQDPKAARIIRATVESQRRAARSNGQAAYRALDGEAKAARIQQINAANTRRHVRRVQSQVFACAMCGARWCNRPLAGKGKPRTRYCSDRCKCADRRKPHA